MAAPMAQAHRKQRRGQRPGVPAAAAALWMEPLEDRILLAYDPTGIEQELLEWIQRMRANPGAHIGELVTSFNPLVATNSDVQNALNFFGVNGLQLQAEWATLTAAQPLAWNEQLYNAARSHSQVMVTQDAQGHQLPGELDPGQRLIAYGYAWNGGGGYGENVYAYGKSGIHTHGGFAIDWGEENPVIGPADGMLDPPGHRNNQANAAFREVGIGVIVDTNPGTAVGELVVTQDFGYLDTSIQTYLLGTVWQDNNSNGRYDSGEGIGGATVTVRNAANAVVATLTSKTAGSYQTTLPAGTYSVTVSGGAFGAAVTQSGVVLGTLNVKRDFQPTPAFIQQGTTLSVYGTDGADTIAFTASSTMYGVSVNGTARNYSAASLSTINIYGQGGTDTITLTGNANADNVTLYATRSGSLVGVGYRVNTATIETHVANGGSNDSAFLFDGLGNDNFVARETYSTLTGPGFANAVNGFGTVRAYANSAGTDFATLRDGAGNDNFYGKETFSYLRFASGNTNWANNFEKVFAVATGGTDYASLFDSSGNDYLVGASTFAYLYGTGFYNHASGFDRVYSTATTGTDRAYLYDTVGNDTFVGSSTFCYLYRPGVFYNHAKGFDFVYAKATAGGTDIAHLYDSAANDNFVARALYSTISAPGYYVYAERFDKVYANVIVGGTDYATMYDGAGNDNFVGKQAFSYMTLQDGTLYSATGFTKVLGVATGGGNDVALLHDSTGNDSYVGTSTAGYLFGTGFYNYTTLFDTVYGVFTSGTDTVNFYDSPGNDTFTGWPGYARIADAAGTFFHQVLSPDTVIARGTAGGTNTMLITNPLGYALTPVGTWV